ncbi:B12-binding domain-containing radical SAM protein [Rhizobium rhizogenes]|uniref:B12-binding domain-containing radical SAM protein n=1 Tax=Rhizobium rhizogenes TaxID=359 RepID=UPI00157409BD|nr:radical SAM protein [Rhizobium rhizogenes]NTF83928.1 B12-binding domain-containing radical SAM protein [Rhizobium rhizogenes]
MIKPASISRPVRIALLSVPYGEGPQAMMPLGLMCIAGYLKENRPSICDVRIFDFSDADEDNPDVLTPLVEWEADCIGVSVYSSHIPVVTKWVKVLRRCLKDRTIIVAGGPHISLEPTAFTEAWGHLFDVAFQGDGEDPLMRLVDLLASNGVDSLSNADMLEIPGAYLLSEAGVVEQCKHSNKQLPSGQWGNPFLAQVTSAGNRSLSFTDFVDNRERRAVALTSSRGCPLQCSFCAIIEADKGTKRWRSVPAETLIEWLKWEHDQRPFEHVYLMDANFFVQPARVREFARALRAQFDGAVTWSTSSTVGYLLKIRPFLDELRMNGLRLVELGIEAGSPTQLKYLNKPVSVEENIAAVRALQENMIQLGLDYIMFYHRQTVVEIQENLLFLLNCGLTQLEIFDHYFNILQLYPKTPIRLNEEILRGIQFDKDVIPDSESLIADRAVSLVFKFFMGEFTPKYMSRIERAIAFVRQKIQVRPAESRLQIVLLKHIPFKILWTLTEYGEELENHKTIPGLDEIISPLLKVESEMNLSKSAEQLGKFSLGARGRTTTYEALV